MAEASQKRSFAVEDLCGKADIFIDHSWVLLCKGVSVETIAKRWKIWAALLCAVTIALTGCGKKSESSASASANAGDHWATGITADSSGNLYVADGHAHIIRKISPSGEITTVAGADGVEGAADGPAAAARFRGLGGIALDHEGNLYVVDSRNCTIRKITPGGQVTTLAGAAGMQGYADGTGSTARFNHVGSIAVDGEGNIYVADGNYQPAATDFAGKKLVRNAIRKITPAGVVTTLAGNPEQMGGDDGTGSTARFAYIYGLATDGKGNIYAADAVDFAIRKITPAGVVTTIAGAPGQPGRPLDGTIATARFADLSGIAVDGAGNIYVGDLATIRKITPQGLVTTLAGSPEQPGSADGMGAAARFTMLSSSMTLDSAGNIFVGDFGSVRKITPAGIVTTLPGTIRTPTPPTN